MPEMIVHPTYFMPNRLANFIAFWLGWDDLRDPQEPDAAYDTQDLEDGLAWANAVLYDPQIRKPKWRRLR